MHRAAFLSRVAEELASGAEERYRTAACLTQ